MMYFCFYDLVSFFTFSDSVFIFIPVSFIPLKIYMYKNTPGEKYTGTKIYLEKKYMYKNKQDCRRANRNGR